MTGPSHLPSQQHSTWQMIQRTYIFLTGIDKLPLIARVHLEVVFLLVCCGLDAQTNYPDETSNDVGRPQTCCSSLGKLLLYLHPLKGSFCVASLRTTCVFAYQPNTAPQRAHMSISSGRTGLRLPECPLSSMYSIAPDLRVRCIVSRVELSEAIVQYSFPRPTLCTYLSP
jgi:hypothetical protein